MVGLAEQRGEQGTRLTNFTIPIICVDSRPMTKPQSWDFSDILEPLETSITTVPSLIALYYVAVLIRLVTGTAVYGI